VRSTRYTVTIITIRLGFSVVSDAERYPGGNGITSGSISTAGATLLLVSLLYNAYEFVEGEQ
jgi:hypothetical protein